MANIERLHELIEPIVTRMGYELVRISFGGGERNATLQVMAERPETGQLVIDDCAEISRALSDMLDELDPIPGEYRLEVSSPGIDRPLTRAKDYETWKTHDARINTRVPVNGRKRHSGVLAGLDGDEVLLETDQGVSRIPLADIDTAKLVLTDRLIDATMPEWRAEADAAAAAQAAEKEQARAARKGARNKNGKAAKTGAKEASAATGADSEDTLENDDN